MKQLITTAAAGRRGWSASRMFYSAGLPGMFLANAGAVTVAAFGADIEKDMGVPHILLGVLQGAFFLGNVLGSLAFSRVVAWRGLKAAGVAAVVLLIFGNAFSTVVCFGPMLAGRMLLGVAVSGMVLFASSLGIYAFPKKQNALLNLIHAFLAIASMTGLAVLGPLASALGGWWRTSMALAVACVGLLSVLVYQKADGVETIEVRGSIEQGWWFDGKLLRWMFVLSAYILAETALVLFVPVLAQNRGGLDMATAARLAAWFIVGIVAGRLLAPWLVPENAGRKLMSFLVLTGGAFLILALTLPSQAPAKVCLIVGGMLAGPVAPLAVSQAVKHVGHSRNAVLSCMNLLSCAGGMVGALAAGWMGDRMGLQAALILCVLVFLIGGLIVPFRETPEEGSCRHEG